MPSSRFASIRCSSSANMYGGIASSRWDGAASPFFLVGAAIEAGRVGQPSSSSARSSSADSSPEKIGSAHPVRRTERSLPISTSSSPPSSSHGEPARSAGQMCRDRRARRHRSRGERLPHPALEDPGAHPIAVGAVEAHVRAVREQRAVLDLGADRRQIERLELLADLDRALRVADRDVLKRPGPARCHDLAPPVLRSGGVVVRRGARPAHLERRLAVGANRGGDRPGLGQDREAVGVRPAGAAEVEHRLPGAVARQLGLGPIGVEDAQLGDVARVLDRREQQEPVRAHPEMRVADPPDPFRRRLPGERRSLDDQVVVAERGPLLELHSPASAAVRAVSRSKK